MLSTTRAIVLRTFKHGDRSTVLKAYTEAFGARSYMVRAGGRSGARDAALQPLSRLELVVTETHEREMHAVRELRMDRPYTHLHTEPIRGALALFTQEVFYRTLREESADPALFAFAQEVLEAMDHGGNVSNFPLVLLVHLARHLGFFPEPPSSGEEGFDLREGSFFRGDPPHEQCMDRTDSAAFAMLMDTGIGDVTGDIVASVRRSLLERLLVYYRLHVHGFGELRSMEVLQQVLH